MPRIPTRDSLRQSVPRAASGIVSAQPNIVGPAVRKAGNQLVDVAKHQTKQINQQTRAKQQRAALELATARSQWTSGLIAEKNAYTPEYNQDPDSWMKTYQSRVGVLQKRVAGVISDPEVRRRFVAEMQDDLEEAGASIDSQAREAGIAVRRAEAERSLLQQVEIAALQSDESAKSVMGGVRASLQDMVDTGIISAEEAAGRSVGYAQRFATLKTVQLIRQSPTSAVSVLKDEQPGPASKIRQLYRFRSTSYWQEGAYRAGYGSDTVTREDGTIVEIAPGMTVSRADAERDLQRRTAEVRSGVAEQVGEKVFDRLAPDVQAALIVAGYRAGLLPDNVATAVRSGDVEVIDAAIARDEDNGFAGKVTLRPWWLGMLEPEQRAGFLEAANQEVERTDARRALAAKTRAWQLRQDVRSDIRSAYSAGDAVDIEPDEVLRELGQVKQRQWLDSRRDAAIVAAKTRNMPNLPDGQIMELVKTHLPQPGGKKAEREHWIHGRVSRRAGEITRERRDNPARAALRIPSVRRALSEAQNPLTTSPQKVQTLVRAIMATQSALGIADKSIAPVPDEWALKIGSAWLSKSSRQDNEMTDDLRKIYAGIKEQFGEFADDVIAYSVSRSAALRRETDGRISELLNSAAVAGPVRPQQAGASDTG